MAFGVAALLMLQIASPLPPPFNSGGSAETPRNLEDELICLDNKIDHHTYCQSRAAWRIYAKQFEARRAKRASASPPPFKRP